MEVLLTVVAFFAAAVVAGVAAASTDTVRQRFSSWLGRRSDRVHDQDVHDQNEDMPGPTSERSEYNVTTINSGQVLVGKNPRARQKNKIYQKAPK